VVADAVTAVAEAAVAMAEAAGAGTVVVAATVVSDEATNSRRYSRVKVRQKPLKIGIGQGWIRTSEGVKPADLQSAPFGHFGTYPSVLRKLSGLI
jgi:hypothetical protein